MDRSAEDPRLHSIVEYIANERNTVHEYDFAGWKFSTADMNYLSNQGIFNRLQTVWLINVGLGAIDIERLCVALEQPTCAVRCLNMNYNALTSTQIQRLAAALQLNRSLRAIYLQGNAIGDVGATALATMLPFNATLEELHLNGQHFPGPEQIGPVGAQQLALALRNDQPQHNTALRQLNLWGNRIGDVGAQAIGDVLQHNGAIEFIGLGRNGITHIGASHLGIGLQHNQSIRALDLRFSQLGDPGLLHLAAGIQHNRSLLYLNIMNCGMTDVGLTNLQQNGLLDVLCAPNSISNLIYLSLISGDVSELVTQKRPWRIGILFNLGWSALKEYRQTGMNFSTGFKIVKQYYSNEANHNKNTDPVVTRLRARCCEILIRFLEESDVTFYTISQESGNKQSFDRMRLRTALRNQHSIVRAMIENNESLLATAHTVWGEKLTRLQKVQRAHETQLRQQEEILQPLQTEVQRLMESYRALQQRNGALEEQFQHLNQRQQSPLAPHGQDPTCRQLEQRNNQLERTVKELQDHVRALEMMRDSLRAFIRSQQEVSEGVVTNNSFDLLRRDHANSDVVNNGSQPRQSDSNPHP